MGKKNIDSIVEKALQSDNKNEMNEALLLLKKKCDRLDRKLNKVIKVADKQEAILQRTQKELEEYQNSLEAKVAKQVQEIRSLYDELSSTQKEVIFTLGTIGEMRSLETGNHVKRVSEYTYILAKEYGLSEREASALKEASPMHDIGKVAIPDHILNKPGKLTKDEFETIKTHTTIGHSMLAHSSKDLLMIASIVALEHHERYDGCGYPYGKKGENIHIYGRITAVADVFDALSHDRCYKPAWEMEKVIKFFRNEHGKQFDPDITNIFFDNLSAFKNILNTYKDEVTSDTY